MKLRRLVACSMAVAMTAGSVMGCSSGQSAETTAENTSAEAGSESATESSSASGEGVKLTMMNSKPEIEDALEEAVKDYQQKTGVEIEVYSTDKPGEVIAQKYAAGDPATLIIGDYSNIKDVAAEKLLPLNDEKWVADGGDLLGIKVDDNLYGFPLCIEAAGLIYNTTAIEEITGEEFKPEDYVTLDEFKPLLEKLKEGGMESPVILNSEDWSIGQHFLQYIYKMHTGKAEDALAFLDEVRQGKANFEDDAVFNALYDTMDVLIDNKADPLAADYDLNASYLAEGESAFWLNGSWAWPDTKEYVDGSMSYGIMPYPVNGDFTSAGQLNANATKFIAIDNVKATPEQQEAAKDFLNWLVYDEEGQDLIVNKCNLVPAFSNIKLDMTNDFNKSVKKYVDEGKVNAYVPIPSDHRSTLAAYMQKYLAGELDRTELAGYLDDYWKNH